MKTASDAPFLRLTPAMRFIDCLYTSLPFVSTAGRGAVLSGTAPAYFMGGTQNCRS